MSFLTTLFLCGFVGYWNIKVDDGVWHCTVDVIRYVNGRCPLQARFSYGIFSLCSYVDSMVTYVGTLAPAVILIWQLPTLDAFVNSVGSIQRSNRSSLVGKPFIYYLRAIISFAFQKQILFGPIDRILLRSKPAKSDQGRI